MPAGRIARFIGLAGSPFPVIDAQSAVPGLSLTWATYGLSWAVETTGNLNLPFAPSGVISNTTNGVSYGNISMTKGQQFFRLRRQP